MVGLVRFGRLFLGCFVVVVDDVFVVVGGFV